MQGQMADQAVVEHFLALREQVQQARAVMAAWIVAVWGVHRLEAADLVELAAISQAVHQMAQPEVRALCQALLARLLITQQVVAEADMSLELGVRLGALALELAAPDAAAAVLRAVLLQQILVPVAAVRV